MDMEVCINSLVSAGGHLWRRKQLALMTMVNNYTPLSDTMRLEPWPSLPYPNIMPILTIYQSVSSPIPKYLKSIVKNDILTKYNIPNPYIAAFKRSEKLHDMLFIDIRTGNIQETIDSCDKGYASKKNIKILANLLFKYGMANDLVNKNYAELVSLPIEEKSNKHKPFTNNELTTLWKNTNDPGARLALIYCYTGLRPTELLRIRNENIFLSEKYMLGGMKTAAGKN